MRQREKNFDIQRNTRVGSGGQFTSNRLSNDHIKWKESQNLRSSCNVITHNSAYNLLGQRSTQGTPYLVRQLMHLTSSTHSRCCNPFCFLADKTWLIFFVTLSLICVNFTAFKSHIDSFDWLYYSSLRYIKNRVQALLFCLDLTYFPEILKRVLGLAMTHSSSGLSMTSEAY